MYKCKACFHNVAPFKSQRSEPFLEPCKPEGIAMPLVYCYCASVASINTNPTTTWCISRVLPGLSSAASSIALLAVHVHVYASLPDSDMLTYGRLLGRLCEPYCSPQVLLYIE